MRRSLLRELRSLSPRRALRFAEAMQVAERQANRLLDTRRLFVPPVPDRVVTKFPRVHVERTQPLGVSGATHWNDGRWLILLNGAEPEVRQRFSAAHELKHVIDHEVADFVYPTSYGVTAAERREQVADYFAACLLMPRMWIKRSWARETQDVAQLAGIFGVSREAMRYRLINIGLVDRTVRCEVA